MQQLTELYKQWKGAEPAHIHQLTGAGSNRSYYRLTDKDRQGGADGDRCDRHQP